MNKLMVFETTNNVVMICMDKPPMYTNSSLFKQIEPFVLISNRKKYLV
jgi:hypothetical protein